MDDYKELIEQLLKDSAHYRYSGHTVIGQQYDEAATAIETLLSQLTAAQDKCDALTKAGLIATNRANEALSELSQVKAERDAFENAEKQGRLAVLPCKVGDTVYSTLDDLGHSYKCEVTGVYLSRREHESYVELDPISYRGSKYGASFGAFGKTVFLTREEAETALEGERKDGEG